MITLNELMETMSKEFSDPFQTLEWKTEGVKPQGAREAILYRDEASGTYSRMIQIDPGYINNDRPWYHDFDEIVYIVDGYFENQRLGLTYKAGEFAVFKKGVKHGSLSAPEGVTAIEFRHYVK